MLSFVGGSRIGWVNATMPFAKLQVSADEVVLSTLGHEVRFAPSEVVRIERVTWLPVLAWGIRIVHTREDVAERVIFWALRPGPVFAAFASEGFTPSASGRDVPDRPFPFRIPFLVAVFVTWNSLFMIDIYVSGVGKPGPLSTAAMGLACVTALGILLPTPIRRLALHRNQDAARVSQHTALVAAITAFLFVMMILDQLGMLAG